MKYKSTSLSVEELFNFSEVELKFEEFKTWLCIALERNLEEKHMTQKELAKASGMTEAVITKMLQGKQNVTLSTLAKLSVALDEDLFLTRDSAAYNLMNEYIIVNNNYPLAVDYSSGFIKQTDSATKKSADSQSHYALAA